MDQDFIFSGASSERKTLKQLLHGEDLDIIIDIGCTNDTER